jgi:hypothetical protein
VIDHGSAAPTPRSAGRRLRELPADERPRERLARRGPVGLSAAELIALVWGSGSRGISALGLAEEALARHDGLAGLARAGELELRGLPGVGIAKAAQLTAAFELGRRATEAWPHGRWTVRAPRDVAERLMVEMGSLEREELRVVLLNTKNVVFHEVWRLRHSLYPDRHSDVRPGPIRLALKPPEGRRSSSIHKRGAHSPTAMWTCRPWPVSCHSPVNR